MIKRLEAYIRVWNVTTGKDFYKTCRQVVQRRRYIEHLFICELHFLSYVHLF